MSISKKMKGYTVSASGDLCDKLQDTVFGGKTHKINRNIENFTNDSIFIYIENDDEDVLIDLEVGVNKNYVYYHGSDHSDNYKNRDMKQRRQREKEYLEYLEMKKLARRR